ncbi:MAG TPA: SDR family oxidoreductase [Nitrososphaeraceae archaeon]|jgi:3-oxoacyl-[acyl-carrier protein] reductase|nr:SDR family oxidoreductase [Nitrososphaeraceae archaeon]
MKLKGKVAVITGAAGGVGKATVKRLSSEGCKVVLIGRNKKSLDKAAELIQDKKNALAIKTDITREGEVISAAEQIVSKFETIDILVNNAGIISDPTPFHLMTEEQWNLLIDTNLLGTFRMTKAVLPFMLKNKSGTIINISSLLGIRAIPNVPLSIYGVTKAGIIMLTKSIAVEYGPFGVRCNCVVPSTIRSPIIEPYLQDENARKLLETSFPLRRIGTPDDISGTVLYLCSSDARWVTGSIVTVDGGISAKQ